MLLRDATDGMRECAHFLRASPSCLPIKGAKSIRWKVGTLVADWKVEICERPHAAMDKLSGGGRKKRWIGNATNGRVQYVPNASLLDPKRLLEGFARPRRPPVMSVTLVGYEDEVHMLQRNTIIKRIMEIQSEDLRCDTERCGLEIELLNTKGNFEDGNMTIEEKRDKIAVLEERALLLNQRREMHRKEQESLYRVLNEIDEGQEEAPGSVAKRA